MGADEGLDIKQQDTQKETVIFWIVGIWRIQEILMLIKREDRGPLSDTGKNFGIVEVC